MINISLDRFSNLGEGICQVDCSLLLQKILVVFVRIIILTLQLNSQAFCYIIMQSFEPFKLPSPNLI